MKLFAQLLIICSVWLMLSCNPGISQTKQSSVREFLYKTEMDTSNNNYRVHIKVRQVLPDTKELIPMTIDDRDIISRSNYSRTDRIKILGEYLTFRGDTATSNKMYHFKPAYHMVHPESVLGFTVEIEALYSFTRMLTVGYPPIKPVLISRATGAQLNTNPEAVRDVYDIYIKWYNESKKNDFKNISLPLTGSLYCWLGEDKGIEQYLSKSF